MADRESRIEARLREMEKRQRDFEKKKKLERKQIIERLHEKQEEW